MTVPTAGFISDLDPASPTNADFVDEGDNWLRFLQETLKTNQFPRSEDDSSNGWDIACTAKCSQVNALDDLVTTQSVETRLSALEAAVDPIGRIAPWPINETDYAQTLSGALAPGGGTWHVCDGSVLDGSTTYASLYAIIANQFGGADAASMQIPDITGRVIAGRGSGTVLTGYRVGVNDNTQGNTGGEQAHTQATDELSAHTHDAGTLKGERTGLGVQLGGSAIYSADGTSYATDVEGDTGTAGSSQGLNVVQPTIIIAWYIRVL